MQIFRALLRSIRSQGNGRLTLRARIDGDDARRVGEEVHLLAPHGSGHRPSRNEQERGFRLLVTAVDIVNADAAANVDIAFAHGRCPVSTDCGRQQ
jgi:hypothetical protein